MKKICFGMMLKNESFMLRRNLPKIPHIFSEYIFIDTGSTDDSKEIILKNIPEAIILEDTATDINDGRWRNLIIKKAEEVGCDWILMLDADEAMFKKDYDIIFEYIEEEKYTIFSLPRLEFVQDENHYIVEPFPDIQKRIFKLNMGYYYYPWVHCTVYLSGEVQKGQLLPQCSIFHYGGIKNHRERWLYYYNINRQRDGLSLVTEYPSDTIIEPPYWETQNFLINTFYGEQP